MESVSRMNSPDTQGANGTYVTMRDDSSVAGRKARIRNAWTDVRREMRPNAKAGPHIT
jgi:hypothetical protein